MRKPTILLMALALALALALIPVQQQTVVVATPPPPLPLHPLRRSRFLASVDFLRQPSFYDCSNKRASFCLQQLAPRSPGAKCCQGTCVDTDYSFQHCGNCNKTCKYAQTCCQRKCVNTFTDENNCGGCGVKCRTKCTNGYCDYAA